jgi:hypothetical protein
LLRRLEDLPAARDLDLLAGTLGEWVVAGGSLLVVTDMDAALDVEPRAAGIPRLPSALLGDLLTLSRAPTVRAALVSRDSVAALRRLVPFTDVICAGQDGRQVEGGGLTLGAHETPGAGWDRGRAVLWMRGQLALLLGPPIKVLYLGAGDADEAAFISLAGKAATVRVGPSSPGSRATFRLDGAGQTRRLLSALARATARQPATRNLAAR